MVQFDIIIPTTDKDLETLEECIKNAKKYIVGYRKIIVISKKNIPKMQNGLMKTIFHLI